MRLLNRTNRSVFPTEAGIVLLDKLENGFRHIGDALEEINRLRERPAGHIKINISRDAAQLLVIPVIGKFAKSFPDVQLEVKVRIHSVIKY